MIGIFGIAYGSIAFAGRASGPCGDWSPTPDHVRVYGGFQNFASNLARIVITTFTRHDGFDDARVFQRFRSDVGRILGVLGAFSYLVIVKKIEPCL